jgi:hypothetical protein
MIPLHTIVHLSPPWFWSRIKGDLWHKRWLHHYGIISSISSTQSPMLVKFGGNYQLFCPLNPVSFTDWWYDWLPLRSPQGVGVWLNIGHNSFTWKPHPRLQRDTTTHMRERAESCLVLSHQFIIYTVPTYAICCWSIDGQQVDRQAEAGRAPSASSASEKDAAVAVGWVGASRPGPGARTTDTHTLAVQCYRGNPRPPYAVPCSRRAGPAATTATATATPPTPGDLTSVACLCLPLLWIGSLLINTFRLLF